MIEQRPFDYNPRRNGKAQIEYVQLTVLHPPFCDPEALLPTKTTTEMETHKLIAKLCAHYNTFQKPLKSTFLSPRYSISHRKHLGERCLNIHPLIGTQEGTAMHKQAKKFVHIVLRPICCRIFQLHITYFGSEMVQCQPFAASK